MQFAEDFFTSGRSDPNHRPKYKTCLMRPHDTYNSKCLNRGLSLEESRVRIVQKWNGKRIDGGAITGEFMIWLTKQEINFSKSSSNMSPNSPKKITQNTLAVESVILKINLVLELNGLSVFYKHPRRSKKILLVANYWSIPTEC